MSVNVNDVKELEGKSSLEVVSQFPNFSIFRKKGHSSRAVFVSTLLHGCEPCGLNAILREISTENNNYNRDVYFMIGNTQAARHETPFTHRLMPDGQNFNRIWVENPETETELEAHEVLKFIRGLPLEALLDLHSFTASTGNPHSYVSDDNSIAFARKLAKYIFRNGMDDGLLIDRTQMQCPSFIVECGTNGTLEADEYAYLTLKRFLSGFEVKPYMHLADLDNLIYGGEVNFKLTTPEIQFGREPSENLTIREDIEKLNLSDVKAGAFFGYGADLRFLESRVALSSDYFYVSEGKIHFKRNCTVNLISKNPSRLVESGFYIYSRE